MNAVQTAPTTPVRIPANHAVTKRLGHWTADRRFQVRAHHGVAVLDLRSPQIPAGDIEIDVDLDRAVLKLLVADDAQIEDWDLRRSGRGRVKDAQSPDTRRPDTQSPDTQSPDTQSPDTQSPDARRPDAPGDRRIVVTGQMRHAEIRVHRGGVAILSAMFSREYLADLRRAHKQGVLPTVDDPARAA
jgi:hypothetical protein